MRYDVSHLKNTLSDNKNIYTKHITTITKKLAMTFFLKLLWGRFMYLKLFCLFYRNLWNVKLVLYFESTEMLLGLQYFFFV